MKKRMMPALAGLALEEHGLGELLANAHDGVQAGKRDAGVQQLEHHIHVFQICFDEPQGLGHVAGKPVNMRFGGMLFAQNNPPISRYA